jgi:hypothetical protein
MPFERQKPVSPAQRKIINLAMIVSLVARVLARSKGGASHKCHWQLVCQCCSVLSPTP